MLRCHFDKSKFEFSIHSAFWGPNNDHGVDSLIHSKNTFLHSLYEFCKDVIAFAVQLHTMVICRRHSLPVITVMCNFHPHFQFAIKYWAHCTVLHLYSTVYFKIPLIFYLSLCKHRVFLSPSIQRINQFNKLFPSPSTVYSPSYFLHHSDVHTPRF